MSTCTVPDVTRRRVAPRTLLQAAATRINAIAEQYRKTFTGMQITIGVVALAVLVRTQRLSTALVFFVVMEVGAVLGAAWAARLKRKVERAALQNGGA